MRNILKIPNTLLTTRSTSALRTFAFALSATLLVSACEAQKPVAKAAAVAVPQANPAQGFRWSEPALIGKIVDADTGLPLKGAFVYGHYATSTGTRAGGSKFGEHVKSFAVETNAEGIFKLEAWDTGDRLIQGERRGKFPLIEVYKPGYSADMQNLDSIRDFTTLSRVNVAVQPVITQTLLDWTNRPYELKPMKTERARFEALDLSGYSMMFDGECGWELYSGLLLARHTELRDWMRRNIPPEQIRADGTFKSGFAPPFDIIFGTEMLFRPTTAEALLNRYNSDKTTWRCANQNDRFALRK